MNDIGLYDTDILLGPNGGRTAAPSRGRRARQRRRDRLAEHHRGGRERGKQQRHAVEFAAGAGVAAHAEGRGLAALPRCAELAGGRDRLSPTGQTAVHALHAAADRRGGPLSRRNAALPETIDGVPPLPVPEACPVTLDELLSDDPAT